MKFYDSTGKLFENRVACEASNVKASVMNLVNKIKKRDKHDSAKTTEKFEEIDKLTKDAEDNLNRMINDNENDLKILKDDSEKLVETNDKIAKINKELKNIVNSNLNIDVEEIDEYNSKIIDKDTGNVIMTMNKYNTEKPSDLDDEVPNIEAKLYKSTNHETTYHVDYDGTILDKNKEKITIESNGEELIMKNSKGEIIDKSPIDEKLKMKQNDI